MLFEIGLASQVSRKYIHKKLTFLLQSVINNLLTDCILVQDKTLNVYITLLRYKNVELIILTS